MSTDLNERTRIDALIARILIAKPELTPDVLRRIVPNLEGYDDHALSHKIEYLRRRGAKRPAKF